MKRLFIISIFLVILIQTGFSQNLTEVNADPATGIGTSVANLNGELVSDGAVDIKYQFRYGMSSGAYPSNTSFVVTNVANSENVSEAISGLDVATQYFYVLYGEEDSDATTNFTSSESSFFTIATEPAASVSDFSLNSRTTNSVNFTYTPYSFSINGGYVLYKNNGVSAIDLTSLEDAKDPDNQSAALSGNDVWEIDETVGDISFTGLTEATQYTMTLVSYNSNGANGETVNYRKSDPPSITFYTLSDPPASKANGGSFSIDAITETTVDLNWDNVSDAQKYLVLYSESAADLDINDVEDGMTPAALSVGFPAGVEYAVSTTSDIFLSGLQANTEYSYYVIPYTEGADPSTINYVTQSGPDVGTFTTDCAIPDAQSSFNATNDADINPLDITVSWDNTITGANRYLVVVKENNPVAFEPAIGTSYLGDVSSDFSAGSDLDNGGGDNIAVYDGAGSSVTVTGLDINTTYHFAVFAYNSDGNCYITPSSPGVANATTEGVQSNNTLSFNSASASINSVNNDDAGGSFINVFDFDIVEGGADGVPTKLEFLTFSRSASDYFGVEGINWDDIIAEAQLVNIANGETQSGDINTDNITIDIASNKNDDDTEIGFVEENTSVNFQLQIRLRESISVADIDNKNLVLNLAPSNILTEGNSSKFDGSSATISSGSGNNQIIVEASDFNFLEPSSTVDINATENFVTVPEVVSQDENGNLDLNYAGPFTISNTDGINMDNLPSSFANGTLTFPINFNYQGSGNGTLQIEDDTDLFSATSSTINVNPKVILAEITESFNNSILESGANDEIVLGFGLTALSSAELNSIEVDVDQPLSGNISNVRLVSSSDDTYDGADSEVVSGVIDDGNNNITFSSLSQNIATTEAYYFIVVDVAETVSSDNPNVTFTLDASNLNYAENVLKEPNTISEEYSYVDNIAPEVVDISVQPASLADANVGTETLQIIIEYNEEMNTALLMEPEITFPTEDPTQSITFSSLSSGWDVDGLVYTAYYNFSDEGVTVKDINVNVASAEDLSGNTQIAKSENDLFSIDTQNPEVTLTLNRLLVNQPNNTITLTAEFNELMDVSVEPDFVISDDVNFNAGAGGWMDNENYSITFTHDQDEEFTEDAFITVSNALDTAGNAIASSASGLFDINTIRPKIEGITSTNASGTFKEGDGPIEITIDFDENITVGGTGNPQLSLNSDASAIATFSNSIDDKITFSYTITDGDNANPLEVLTLDLNGATILNSANNPAILGLQGNALSDDKMIEIDTESPMITAITSDTPNGIYGPGEEINIKVVFSEDIQQTGTTPTLSLNTGVDAIYENITNGNELNFTYTVGTLNSGENTNDLAVTAISASENEILDIVGNASDLTLSATNNTLDDNKNITIDTDPPSLDASPFFPANGSLNVSLSEAFSITLNEAVSGAGTANIKLVDVSDGAVLATLDGASAFANSSATTLTFNSLSASLQDSTEYYFEFDAGAIEDIAGNPLPSFTGASNWSFTTFGPARLDNFSVAACVGEVFVIEGQYFTGVSEILTDVDGGSPYEITSFSIDDDHTISFTVPSGTVPGKITLNKINGQDGNTDNASTTSETAIKVGPSSGDIKLVTVGTDVVCNVPGSDPAPVETSILFDIVGGSGVYEVEFSDGVNTFTESSYNSGQAIQVNPPANGINTYSIISIVDEDPDLNSCIVDDASKFTDLDITEYEQSEVEAGGTFDPELAVSTVPVCLAEEDEIDLSDISIMGTIPEIIGDISDGEWTIVDGPNSGGGGFSSNFSSKTTSNLTPTYYPSLADASYGSVTLRLISDDPAAPNPCSRDFDEVTLVFVNTVSVNVGPDLNACIETDEFGSETVIQALDASLGGGASALEWSRVDNTGEAGSHDGSWGFASSPSAVNFTLTSTLEDPFYKASPQEIITGKVTLNATTTGGGCGAGTPASKELEINISELPTPTRSLAPTDVCSGEEGVRYRMSGSTQSTFEWSLTNEGLDSPGQNDKNQIDGLKTGNILIVNFREVTTETKDTLIVQEINPNTGCKSISDSIFITIKPKPVTNITYNGNTTISQGDPRILLTGEGGQSGNIQPGGVFSGPGVVQDPQGNYYIDPSILNVTDISDPSDDVIITFTYNDDFSCSASENIRFNIYAENSSFQNLMEEYCVSDDPSTIFVTPSVTGSDFEVIGIDGPGITELGLQEEEIEGSTTQVFKAIFNPLAAYEDNAAAEDPSEVEITFTTREKANPSNVNEAAGFQTVRVVPLPTLEFEEPEYDFCTYDEPTELTTFGSNNQLTYQFSIVTQNLPNNLLLGDSLNGFEFDPAPLFDYLDSIGEESIEIEMEYRYTNSSGCSNSENFTFNVFKQPTQPEFNETNLCNINGQIEEAIITNYAGSNPDLELEWFMNSSLSGEPVATGISFTPTAEFFVNNDEVKFYVSRRNINSQGEDDVLCGSEATEITYRSLGIPEISWNRSSFGSEPIVFEATHNETNVVSYTWDIYKLTPSGQEKIKSDSILDLGNKTLAVDFETYGAGQYQIDFTINTQFRCNTSVSQQIIILPKNISDTHYSYDFEGSNDGWVASIDNLNSWEWNKPSESSNIQTEGAFWVTNASGSYNSREQSYVYSPAMDLTQIEKPVVAFDLWLDVINDVDGLILEYSTDSLIIEDPAKEWQLLGNFDDGISSGLNWYESTGVRSRPGTDNLTPEGVVNNNIFGQAWSRESDGIVTKIEAKHALSAIDESERSNVIFRFQFKSNTTGFLPDGVAFDNFVIESLNRNVLVEYFGDEDIASDTTEMRSLASEFANSSGFSWINYRIDEEDVLFRQNTSAMLSRIYQYDAYNASNLFALDGEIKEEYSFSSNAGKNDLSNNRLVSSIVNMNMAVTKTADDQLSINVNYNATNDFPENTRLFIAVLQKEIKDGKYGTDANKEYYNVLRTLLPTLDGLDISEKSSGEVQETFTAYRESDNDELLLVSFIQNIETGEVYQSANWVDVPRLTYSNVTANSSFENTGIQIYPNPAKEQLNLIFENQLVEKVRLKIFDLTGKVIEEVELEQGTFKYELNTKHLKTGMYNLLISNNAGDHKVMKFAVVD